MLADMVADKSSTAESAATRHSETRSEQMRQYQSQTSKDDAVVAFCHANDPTLCHLPHEQRALETLRDFQQKFGRTSGDAATNNGRLTNGSG